jgi:colanic acid biosynthesis glycosyl transferase WcaI
VPSLSIVTPNYHPETNAAARRMTALAEQLVARGWTVHVITQLPHYPQNAIYEGWQVETPHVAMERGVSVTRLRPWIVGRTSLPLRLLAESRFCLAAASHLRRLRTSAVFGSIPFMFIAQLILAVGRVSGRRVILDIRDLTWQYPRASGKTTWGLDRVIDRLMRWTVRHVDVLTATTEGQTAYFSRKPGAWAVVPNGVALEVFEQLASIDPEVKGGGRPEVLYAGLFGFNQNLRVVIDTAALLPGVDFTLVGDGPERSALAAAVKEKNLRNVQLLPYASLEQLLQHYRRATILVSHVRHHEVYANMQSAKVWEYMAVGKPLIHAAVGPSAALIEELECGLAPPPDDPGALANAIRSLLDNPLEARRLGTNARRLVRGRYIREQIIDELEILLRSVVDGTPYRDRAHD